jgi:hypothetical protein
VTFRDDRDAMLARNDALEEENARLKEELAKARAPKPEPPKPKPPKPKPPRSAMPTWFSWAWKVAAVAIVFVGLTWWGVTHDPEKKEADRAEAEHLREENVRYLRERWASVVSVEPCFGSLYVSAHYGLLAAPDRYDPRAPRPMSEYLMQDRMLASMTDAYCLRDLVRVTLERGVTPEARRSLAAFLRENRRLARDLRPLQTYLANRDWQEDDYAGGLRMWREVAPQVQRWREALGEARSSLVPPTRAIVEREANARAERADLVYWRLRIGLAYRDFMALCIDQLARGPDLDREAIAAALSEPAAALALQVERAPIEVRRSFRSFDPAGYVRAVYDPAEALANLIRTEHDILAATAADESFEISLPARY